MIAQHVDCGAYHKVRAHNRIDDVIRIIYRRSSS